jgi:hypothetical protein
VLETTPEQTYRQVIFGRLALDRSTLYGGIMNAELAETDFELGDGVRLKRTFAHLMSVNLMAFAPPVEDGKHHGGPWKSARGGRGYDITIEIQVPIDGVLPGSLPARETVWLFAALVRLAKCPYLMVPVISSHSFEVIAGSEEEPILEPFETEMRLFSAPDQSSAILDSDLLTWVSQVWSPTAKLMGQDKRFDSAFRAFDLCTIRGRTSSSLLTVWGALEQLFAPSTSELRYRVSSNIAAYLNPPGENRLKAFREILDLYNHRSTAAHTAKDADQSALLRSYILMRNALVLMIQEQRVPDQKELEQAIFSPKLPQD